MTQIERPIAPDVLRGAAALTVTAAHAWQIFLLPYTGGNAGFMIMGGLATWSVCIFFILSGMLIGGSVAGRMRDGSFSLRSYAAARFLRIYPPLVLSVIVGAVCVLITQVFALHGAESYRLPGDGLLARERVTFSWEAVWNTLTLTYGLIPGRGHMPTNGSLWSLAIEWWFYVLAGLLAFSVTKRSIVAAVLAACLAFQMFFVSTVSSPPFWTLACVWGGGAAYGFLPSGGKRWLSDRAPYLMVVALLAALAIAGGNFAEWLRAPYTGLMQQVFYIVCASFIALLMVRFMHESGLETVSVFRKLAKSADYAYTLYLLHFPLFLFSMSLFRPSVHHYGLWGAVGLAFATFVVVLGFSAWAARWFENRAAISALFSKLKALFSSKAARQENL